MATAKEVQESIGKSLEDAVTAIRRLGQQNDNLLEMVRALTERVAKLESDVVQIRTTVNRVQSQPLASVSRYE